MDTAVIAGSFALGGVLVGNLSQYFIASRTHRLTAEKERRRDREQAYAEVLTRMEEARQAALLASVRGTAAGRLPSLLERSRASASARVALEQATFRAWLLASPRIRKALDEMTEAAYQASQAWWDLMESNGSDTREGWPTATALREAMRQELADLG